MTAPPKARGPKIPATADTALASVTAAGPCSLCCTESAGCATFTIRFPPVAMIIAPASVTTTLGPAASSSAPAVIRQVPISMIGRRPKYCTSRCEAKPTATAPTAIAVPCSPPTPFETPNSFVIKGTMGPIDMMNHPQNPTEKETVSVMRSRCSRLSNSTCSGDSPALARALHNIVDAFGECFYVGGFDSHVHRHPQLIAAEFAIRLDIDDPIGAQDLSDLCGIHGVSEVDCSHHIGAGRRVGYERRRELRGFRPRVQMRGRFCGASRGPAKPAVGVHPVELFGEHQQGGDSRSVECLIFTRVIDRGLQRQEFWFPACRRLDFRDAGKCSGAH